MARIPEQVRLALYGKLNVAAVTASVGTRIYYGVAPESASTPFIVFTRSLPGRLSYVLTGATALEDDLWMVTVATTEDDDATKSPPALGTRILRDAETAIGNVLTLSSNTVTWCARFAYTPPVAENVNDRLVWKHGFLLRVGAE